jgi:hypothetical protein
MGGRINIRWGLFDLKLEFIVLFLRVKVIWEQAAPPPPSSEFALNLEITILFMVVEGFGNYVFEDQLSPLQLSGKGL